MADPGTVGLELVAVTGWLGSAVGAMTGLAPWPLTIAITALSTVALLIVLHEAAHHNVSRHHWINELVGRVAMPFVAPYCSLPTFRFIHARHHRYTNHGPAQDPDAFVTDAPWWQLPVRWMAFDFGYVSWYLRRLEQRPAREIAESTVCALIFDAAVVWCLVSGWGGELLLVWLIPQRIGFVLIGWGFAWLPHHGLEETPEVNDARATRARVGLEWLLTPLFFSQNYHLLHHLHPRVPFHRYLRTWRSREDELLDRDPALVGVFGRPLSAESYRARRAAAPGDRVPPVPRDDT